MSPEKKTKAAISYKVCVLTAGAGGRMGELGTYVNKAVLPVNFKAVISYIVEKFAPEIEIVVAIGHKKDTVVDYLALAHPERQFTFVNVDRFVGPGTGPGYSLLQCRDHLQCPFVFFAADTLVLEDVPPPTKNWFGIAPVKNTENYCTVKIKNNLVCKLDDKIKTDNRFAFIGLAGVHNYPEFFAALESSRDVIKGEIQVSNGFKELIAKQLVPIGFTWFDTGNVKNYAQTNRHFTGSHQKFDFSKGNEFIYFVNGRVIKWFADAEIARKRCERAEGTLQGLCPPIEQRRGGFYSYRKIDGQTLYSVLNAGTVREFLQWAHTRLWRREALSDAKQREFQDRCLRFYRDKTRQRLEMFYLATGVADGAQRVNGVTLPALADLLSRIDWDFLADGIPSHFHGDLHFDNVLVRTEHGGGDPNFMLLDWRQDFAGAIDVGDQYYDLAKLYGGTIVSYQLIKEGMFSFDMSEESAHYNFFTRSDLMEAKEVVEEFIVERGFDLGKVKLITALIFLNMAPLHQEPFNRLLYFLGRSQLAKVLKRRTAAIAVS